MNWLKRFFVWFCCRQRGYPVLGTDGYTGERATSPAGAMVLHADGSMTPVPPRHIGPIDGVAHCQAVRFGQE